jgi:microcin C transport system permease protein
MTVTSQYRGAQGLDPEFIAELEAPVRLRQATARALRADDVELYPLRFRRELFPRIDVIDLIIEKAAGFDLARALDDAAFLRHLDSAGDRQGGRDGSRFDVWTSGCHCRLCDTRASCSRILLIVLFAGGSFWDWFPLRGLTSDNFSELSLLARSSTISGTSPCR